MDDYRIKATVLELIGRAKSGTLSGAEFRERWPAEAREDGFLSVVYDDVDEAVQHLPAKRGEVDLTLWHGFWERSVLDLDECLVESGGAVDELLRCRRGARPHDIQGRSETEIARFVAQYLGSERPRDLAT
jgi:hypothetical protein